MDALYPLLGIDCVTISWRVQRVALLLRLINSPAGSLKQVALQSLRQLESPWFQAALADLRLVLPDVVLSIGLGPSGPFLYSTGQWNDAGEWCSAQPYGLWRNMNDRLYETTDRYESKSVPRSVQWHIRRITDNLRLQLRRAERTQVFATLLGRSSANLSSKSAALSEILQCPGPPLHLALDWIASPRHRSAVAALLCGDLYLGRYAGNFFARRFIPASTEHLRDAANLDLEPEKVCVYCWHCQRQLILDSEGHAFFECPLSDSARGDFLNEISTDLRSSIDAQGSGGAKLLAIFGSSVQSDWSALGRLAARIRQRRRFIRRQFEGMSDILQKRGYTSKRDAWRSKGGVVCRHGVFYTAAQGSSCNCMLPIGAQDWQHARFMPSLDSHLRALTVVPFDADIFQRLGQLRAEMRRRND